MKNAGNTPIVKTGFLKLKKAADLLGGSFWFIPSIMISIALSLAFVLESIDTSEVDSLESLSWFTTDSAETSLQLLQVIASSVITVTSIAFSMTLIALTMASNQFGPRLLRNFMQDKRTQLVLGAFTSTFVYTLIVIGQISVIDEYTVNPVLSVVVAKLLVILCVFVLIYFIHHVAISISADEVVENVYRDLLSDFKALQEVQQKQRVSGDVYFDSSTFAYSQSIRTHKNGYLQAISYEGLCQFAQDNDGVLKLEVRAGKHILSNHLVATLYSNTTLSRDLKICDHFVVGSQRTPLQDPEYAISQLVEMALRALSPSLNDPFTAINCINKIAAALSTFTTKNIPQTLIVDTDDELRVVTNEESVGNIVENSFNQIRQSSKDNLAVTLHLLDTYILMLSLDIDNSFLDEPINKQVCAIRDTSNSMDMDPHDRNAINDRFLQLGTLLEN